MKTATDTYDEGYQAFLDGKGREDNPYPAGSDEANGWDAGWDDSGKANWEKID